ncbi:MAG: hypothetical protein COA57_01310 [Flavobacteriales bacterium]|nr:MAG: hypothetical protein COA57_01310 [Flavobacteriales bacterium]
MPNATLLIATSRYAIRYANGKIHHLQSGKGVYFGVTKANGHYVFLARNKKKFTSLEFFDANFQFIKSHRVEDVEDGHQLRFINGYFYIANTGKNCITKISENLKEREDLFWTDADNDNHVNSINFCNEHFYIVCHRDKANKDNGHVLQLAEDFSPLKKISVGKHPHDIEFEGEILYSNDSRNSKLIKFDLQTRKRTVAKLSSAHLQRGIAIDKRHLFIGLSKEAKRRFRHWFIHSGYVLKCDKKKLKIIETIKLPRVGQVNDLILS